MGSWRTYIQLIMIKCATWNVCLGLTNKKDIVLNELRRLDISICSLQEVDIKKEFPIDTLASKDYKLEVENNSIKARTAIYIKTDIEYKRMHTIEEPELNVIIIDINLKTKVRLVNLYRVFNPVNGMSQIDFFRNQMRIVHNALATSNGCNVIINGDFNLDYNKSNSLEYSHANYFDILNETIEPFNLIQLVDFPTWERLIIAELKQSILDHVYVRDFSFLSNLSAVKPIFGDHCLVAFDIEFTRPKPTRILRRNWRSYSKEKLLQELRRVDFGNEFVNVQSCWNVFENNLINVIDKMCPMEQFVANNTIASLKVPPTVKNKLNLRKRLLKRLKVTKDQSIKLRINQLNIEIKNTFMQSNVSP